MIDDERILEYAPSYRLSPLAAELFGGERVWTYSLDFNETDSRILALEYHELGECIRTGRPPEVTGEEGRADVALDYAPFEAGRLGRPVTLDELIAGERRRLPARDRRAARPGVTPSVGRRQQLQQLGRRPGRQDG